ncbi:MAG TPA: alkaline phosphatase family protein [Candidatus Polarisedimenticolia bacterium]|nr:alkaline phosphatase family protein [Candidatus Polarisedimenticolia bacterium]
MRWWQRAALLGAAAGFAVMLAWLGRPGRPAGPVGGPAEARPGRRILLVGLDGADWRIADPLIRQGRLPHLARLREQGAWGSARAMTPVLSPLLWTTIATGTTPDQHGIIDFLVPDPSGRGRIPVSSASRRVPALWSYFTAFGRSSDVVAWWATWPAEPVIGRMVSDRVAYSLFDVDVPAEGTGLTWPDSLHQEVLSLFVSDAAVPDDLLMGIAEVGRGELAAARARLAAAGPGALREPLSHLIRILSGTMTYHAVAMKLLRSGQADFTAVYYQGIDEVCHRFIHFAPPRMEGVSERDVARFGRVVERFYELQDRLLGELLAAAAPETLVMVISDHGFASGPDRIEGRTADIEGQPARWHRRHGIALVHGPGAARGAELGSVQLVDVAPTLLAAAGLPIPDSLPGRMLTAAFDPSFVQAHPERRVASASLPASVSAGRPAPGAEPGSAAMMETLRSLGYVGGTGTESGVAGSPAPVFPTAHQNMAGVHLAAGDLERAEPEIAAALRMAPSSRTALAQMFELRLRQGRHDEAIAAARRLLAVCPPDEPGTRLLARISEAFLLAGRGEEGVALMQEEREKGRWRAGGAEARLRLEAKQADRARTLARETLARDPLDESAMAALVQAARLDGGVASLRPELEAALARRPESVMHLNWLSLAAMEAGDLDGAEELLERALDVHPDHGGTMANLGALHLRRQRADRAVPLLARAVELNPRNVECRVNLGTAWAIRGRYAEAIREFAAVERAGHRLPAVRNALARAFLESGDRPSARRWLEASLELDPSQEPARRLLAGLEAGDSD